MKSSPKQIALLGNPNSGKSSLFNLLTGLNQKTGNYPGVTVEKIVGTTHLGNGAKTKLIDLPGTYSLYPNSKDERVVVQILTNPKDEDYPDAVVYVADITNLERQLLLLTQIKDLGIPVLLALSMTDIAEKKGIEIDVHRLEIALGIPIISFSSRTGKNVDLLKQQMLTLINEQPRENPPLKLFYAPTELEQELISDAQVDLGIENSYQALLSVHHHDWLPFLSDQDRKKLHFISEKHQFESLNNQINETMARYDRFLPAIKKAIRQQSNANTLTDRIDNVVMHRYFGPVIFGVLMFLVFQAIFAWAAIPMDWIDAGVNSLSGFIKNTFPDAWYTDLLTDGIISGLGGIIIFIPQIAILFFLVGVLESTGYMARAVFIFDKMMQRFGLNGRSIVALISGGACAIPAIMSTRTISNWKERLITIMVTPLISCSARIPVFVMLVGLVIPADRIWGILSLQGLAFAGLYVLGILAALVSALVFKWILKSEERSFLLMELPPYKFPYFKNIFLSVWEKVKTFILEAGKIILVISVILWALASFGPGNRMQEAEQEANQIAKTQSLDDQAHQDLIASKKLEASFAGIMGKFIEPAIEPLGFDWKIGIALLTSFAAREVFVGTMATLYSIGSEEDELRIKDRLEKEVNPQTGEKVFTFATSISLLLFYLFALQCMSTLAVVKRETNSWKWPVIQFFFMSAMAYLASLAAYQLLN